MSKEKFMEYLKVFLQFVVEHKEELIAVATVLVALAVELARKWQDINWLVDKIGL